MTIRRALVSIIMSAAVTGVVEASDNRSISDSAQSSAYLFLRGVPDRAIVVVNSDTVTHLRTKPIRVPAGAIRVLVLVSGMEMYSRPLPFQPDEKKIINIGNNPKYSLVDIISEPLGADVFIDGKKAGVTPYFDSLVEPGLYKIETRKPGYDPQIKIVLLTPQEEYELSLDLKHSQEWIDSVSQERFMRKQKKRFMAHVVFGALGLAFSGASLYFDLAAQRNLDIADASAADYSAAKEGFQSYKDKYYQGRDAARKDIEKRNILAVLSAGAALGFSLSFVF